MAQGVGDPAKVLELNRAYEKQAATVQSLTRQYRALNTEVKETSLTTNAAVAQVGKLATSFTSLGGVLGVLRGGLAAFGIGKFLTDIAGGLDSFNKSLLDINKQAQATDLKPEIIKAFRIEAEKLNVDADAAMQSFVRFNRSLSEARVKSADASREVTRFGTTVVRGAAAADDAGARVVRFGNAAGDAARKVQVLRGGEQKVVDIGKPFEAAEIDVKNYTDAQIKAGQGLRDFLAELQRMEAAGQGAKANAIAFAAFGRGVKESFVLFEPLLKLLEDSGKLKPLQGAIDNAVEYNKKLVEVEKSTMAIPKAIYAALTPLATQFLTNLEDANQRYNKATIDAWNASVAWLTTNILPTMTAAWTAFADDISALFTAKNWEDLWSGLVDSWNKTINWMIEKWRQFTALATTSPGAKAGITPFMPMASGGRVPGSGSGDTVPAMLTPGEFVIRRAVVDALGPAFFARLNGGMGGILPRRHFASGGLVMAEPAGGGTPVHLHIGGGSFPLNGAPAVVSALVVEAHRQHIRSAGVKPSWYGGR